ncbi:MAG TPA: ATP-binding protein [Acidiferrobacterales bacterium]|nr:ATP-binding protein [Acidiferrobacterales bacterium]
MTPRPYIKSSIDELEKLFEASQGDPQALRALLEELVNRSTSRARKLRAAVEKQLAGRSDAPVPASSAKVVTSKVAQHRLNTFVHARNLTEVMAFCGEIGADSAGTIACDAAELQFVDPVGLCLLAATCHRLATQGKRLRLENVSPAIAGYLARMDLFKACGIEYKENFARHDRQTDLVEICVADKAAEGDLLANKIVTALVGATPGYDPHAAPDEMTGYQPQDYLYKPLHYLFSELLENALTHAKRAGYKDARAWVAAQYYPRKDRIQLAVVDNGCGLLRSLERHPSLPEKSHKAAIRLAFEPRVTCNPDLGIRPNETVNQGIGLTVIREIVVQGRGVMRLVSGDTLLETAGGREKTCPVTPWQGVVLALEFKRDLLRQVNVGQIIHELRGKPGPGGLRFE